MLHLEFLKIVVSPITILTFSHFKGTVHHVKIALISILKQYPCINKSNSNRAYPFTPT